MTALAETLTIENVGASTGVRRELDLETLAIDRGGADYDPDNFLGVVYRTQGPEADPLIFRSGKIVRTGVNSVDDVQRATEIVFDTLQKVGIPINGSPEITVQNIVTSTGRMKSLNLNAIAIGLGVEYVEYEPDRGLYTDSTSPI